VGTLRFPDLRNALRCARLWLVDHIWA
jgi:hypothetical protein